MSSPLILTEITLLPKFISLSALIMFVLAFSLSSGATESSKSKKITSVSDFAAFSKKSGELPGTANSLLFNLVFVCLTLKKLIF